MLYATNRFPGDGITTQYEISFVGGYLNRSHVKAYIEDAALVQTPITLTAGNFLGPNTIQGLPTVPVGSTLVILRDTPKAPIVDFVNGSRMTEANLDTATRQGAFIAAEGADVLAVLPPATASEYNAAASALLSGQNASAASASAASASTSSSSASSAASGAFISRQLAEAAAAQAEAAALAGGLTIAVLGDSLTAQQVLLTEAWPTVLERQLNENGLPCAVHNLAINGWTFNKANTVASFQTLTQVQKAIALSPKIVIVALGFNDTVMAVEGRSIAQAKADAAATFTALSQALPTATIIYASELNYDATHGTVGALTNKQTLPALMQRRSSGILAGLACAEMLSDSVSGVTNVRVASWSELDTYVKSLPTVAGTFILPVWKASRVGLTGTDGLHMTSGAARFLAGSAFKAFTAVTALASYGAQMSNQNYSWFMDSDNLFNSLLTSTGSEYTEAVWSTNAVHADRNTGPFRVFNPSTWYLPSKGTYFSSGLQYTQGTPFLWSLTGVATTSVVYASINGGVWESVGITNSVGYFDAAANLPVEAFPVGTSTIRYRVADEVHGPVTLTVTAGSGGGGSYTLPAATPTVRGGVRVGTGLSIDTDLLSVPDGSPTVKGALRVGNNLRVTAGEVNVNLASPTTLGVIKVGGGLQADGVGTLSVKVGANLSVGGDGALNAASPGAWQTISPSGGWSTYAGTTPAFRLEGGCVRFKGAVTATGTTASSVMFTLPVGYRAPALVGVACAGGGITAAAITTDTTGNVTVSGTSASGPVVVFLDGATFSTS